METVCLVLYVANFAICLLNVVDTLFNEGTNSAFKGWITATIAWACAAMAISI